MIYSAVSMSEEKEALLHWWNNRVWDYPVLRIFTIFYYNIELAAKYMEVRRIFMISYTAGMLIPTSLWLVQTLTQVKT